MNKEYIINSLNKMIPNPVIELDFNTDYEMLLAVMLSANSTDKRVNIVTKDLFKYNLEEISKLSLEKLEDIIRSVGSYKKKASYTKDIAINLVKDYGGKVPNNREYLENLPGVGRKTASVVLSHLYDVPTIAVDTHVKRVSNILFITNSNNVLKIEKDIMNYFPKEQWNKINSQLVLFGRYTCKARAPECDKCLFNGKCRITK